MINKALYCIVVLALSLAAAAIQQEPQHKNELQAPAVGDLNLHLTDQEIEHTLMRSGLQFSSTTDCDTWYTDCRIACVQEYGNLFTPQLADCFVVCATNYNNCKAGQ